MKPVVSVVMLLGVFGVGYWVGHVEKPAPPSELSVGQIISVSQPVGDPAAKQFAEQRFRVVRIHSMRQDRTPEDHEFEGKFAGVRITFWNQTQQMIVFAEE